MEDLFSRSSSFSFVQAMRLISFFIHAEGDRGEEIMRERIRVRPALSLDFPGNDIVSISRKPGDPDLFCITATFLGLYGASSPMPTFYTEDLLEEAADDRSISREFIDIINIPVYHLFFKCWAKYNIFYKIVESYKGETLDRLYCLLGFGTDRIKECFDEPHRYLRYIGLATQMPKSAEGLRSLISDAIREPSVEIEQCVQAMVSIPGDQRLMLGASGHCLGENSSIGFEVSDVTGRFRIHAGPLSFGQFQDLLPDGEAFGRIGKLVGFYLDQPLEWDIEIQLDPGDIQPACLGGAGPGSKLGWNTWLNNDGGYRENRVRLGSAVN